MQIAGRIVAFFLGVLAIPILTAAACNMAIAQTLLDAETYRNAFENQNVFENVLPVAIPAIIEASDFEQFNDNVVRISDVSAELTTEDWQRVTNELIPPEWLQARFNQAIDSLMGMFDGDTTVLDDTVDTRELQQRFTGDHATRAANLIIDAAVDCTQTQIDQIRVLRANGDGTLPICRPPAELRETSLIILENWMARIARSLPDDSITVGEFFQIEAEDVAIANLLVEMDSQLLSLLYLCPAGLIALIVFFAVRSLKGFGRWVGGVCLATGFTFLIVLLLMQFILINSVTEIFSASDDIELFVGQIYAGIIRSVFSQSSIIMLVQGALFIALGFLLIVISIFAPSSTTTTTTLPAGQYLITEDGKIISTTQTRTPDEQ